MYLYFIGKTSISDILDDVQKDSQNKILWKFVCSNKEQIAFPFCGVPFMTAGRQVLQCHHGKDIDDPAKHTKLKQRIEDSQVCTVLNQIAIGC